MTYGIIVGDDEWAEEHYPRSEDYVDAKTAEWIRCPECGSDAAGFILWGEGVDMNFECTDCGASRGIR